MEAECYPISMVPGTSSLFRDFAENYASPDSGFLRQCYPSDPFSMDWARHAPALAEEHRYRLADALRLQSGRFEAGDEAVANIDHIRNGAAVVVTGQQVGLFGGPLLGLLKAATAIRKAQDARQLTGRAHVPVFWLASEDHDVAEIDRFTLPAKEKVETFHLDLVVDKPLSVGSLKAGGTNEAGRQRLATTLDAVSDLLGWAPVCDLLRECYTPESTMAEAYGKLLTKIFAAHGLVVVDAASREFHALGASTLKAALESADELEQDLLRRSEALIASGYHAQVLVRPKHSLLFLLDADSGARLPLRRTPEGGWKAGTRSYTTAELILILASEPERISPNALLRPVFQDTILPTAAYIGGPAEVAYFAQSAVVYEKLLGRVTPVLPRLSATLVEPTAAGLLATHEVTLPQIWDAKTIDVLAMRLGARSMPIESKRRLSAVGNAMDTELTALSEYMTAMSTDLGRAAAVSASKMRYQMNRLRRLAANYELQKKASLSKHASGIMLNLFPDGHLQERSLGGVFFLARHGDTLPDILVQHAGQECPGHRLVYL